jgi:hypothetical protein
MIPQKVGHDDFSVSEWFRLDHIADKYDSQLKQAYLTTVVRGTQANSLIIRNVITDCVIETGVTTAQTYGMVFNPNSPVYRRLIDLATGSYMQRVMNDESAKDSVKAILPHGLSLSERRNRLNVFGLDARSAVRIERMRQDGAAPRVLEQTRLDLSIQRGNIVALTEINRVINLTLETVWIDNLKISKAEEDVVWFDQTVPGDVVSITNLPKKARKEIVTRRDDRVCNYCLPLDGVKARLSVEFDTDYGFFMAPPFHPRCRCFMIVSI